MDIRTTTAAVDLATERDIADCIIRLFVSTDTRDWAGVRACLTDTVRFDMTSLVGGEPADVPADEIVAGWTRGLAPIESVHHQVGNFRIAIHGDEADAFCYGLALHYRRTASGRNTRTFVGSYDFKLVSTDDAWRISAFRFGLKFIDGNLDLEKDG
jgi:3-phenylpropionate/cinnamic acid dioxygenase small subunit